MWRRWRTKLFCAAGEGKFASSHLLRPLSGMWGLGATVKNYLYQHQFLAQYHLPVPVISVGSLTAGGSGKTPLVCLLAQALAPYGPIAILSRGYRAKESGLPLGDEGSLLAKRCPNARVYVGKDRRALGDLAAKEGAKLCILDDGFQYRALYRDIECVILNAEQPFGFGAFLPRGLLRDPPTRLKETDAIFMHGAKEGSWIGVEMRCQRLLTLAGKETAWPKVGALFSAIAFPKRFQHVVTAQGTRLLANWILEDHGCFEIEELDRFARKVKEWGGHALLCTEKDAVKLPKNLNLAVPVVYPEMEMQVVSGSEYWYHLLEKIKDIL